MTTWTKTTPSSGPDITATDVLSRQMKANAYLAERIDEVIVPIVDMAETMTNQECALYAFNAKKAEIDTMLARLVAHSESHFRIMPDDVIWMNVDDLARIASDLKKLSDFVFIEGEYA